MLQYLLKLLQGGLHPRGSRVVAVFLYIPVYKSAVLLPSLFPNDCFPWCHRMDRPKAWMCLKVSVSVM